MKKLLCCLLFVLLVACSPTKVVRIDSTQVQETKNYDVPVEIIGKETAIATDNNGIVQEEQVTNTGTASDTKTSSESSKNTARTTTAANANEYDIVSCCTEGILYAKTAKNKSEYTEQQKRAMLLELYYTHCDAFNNDRNAVNLRYADEASGSDYLVAYIAAPEIRKISINNVIDKNFDMCD